MRCLIGRALVEVPQEYRSALERVVNTRWDEGGLTPEEAALVMNESGLKASATALTRHRRGLCLCTKGTTQWATLQTTLTDSSE